MEIKLIVLLLVFPFLIGEWGKFHLKVLETERFGKLYGNFNSTAGLLVEIEIRRHSVES